MVVMLIYVVEHFKAGLELPEGAEHSFSPPPIKNCDPNPSRAFSPTRPVSDRMQFGNHTLCLSGEAAVVGSGLGHPL